jgi:cytochrome b involved in lipid metabolism
VGHVAGFTLNAGVVTSVYESGKLERLCWCIARQVVYDQYTNLYIHP